MDLHNHHHHHHSLHSQLQTNASNNSNTNNQQNNHNNNNNNNSNNCIVRFDDGQESSQSEPLVKSEETRPIFSLQNILALLFALVFMTLNFVVIAIIHERVPMYNATEYVPPMPDLAADYLPNYPYALNISETIISAQAFMVFVLLFIHKYRVTIFRRVCIIMGTLYLYRAICMYSTQVPLLKSDYCRSKMTDEERNNWATYLKIIVLRVVHMMRGFGLSMKGDHVYCGDYIYSGHTVTLTFFYLTLHEYLVPKNSRCRSILWSIFDITLLASSFIGVILVLIARGHYLIDVLLAYYVTTRTFYIYHTMIYNKSLRYATHKNYLSRVWWWYLMKYLEYDHVNCSTSSRNNGVCLRCDAANTEVVRKFSWPFAWPISNGKRSTSLQRLLSQTPQP